MYIEIILSIILIVAGLGFACWSFDRLKNGTSRRELIKYSIIGFMYSLGPLCGIIWLKNIIYNLQMNGQWETMPSVIKILELLTTFPVGMFLSLCSIIGIFGFFICFLGALAQKE